MRRGNAARPRGGNHLMALLRPPLRRAPSAWLLVAISAAGMSAMAPAAGRAQAPTAAESWTTYGHDSGGMRYSPLTEITPANVGRLKQVWVFHMRPAGAAAAA